MKLEKFPGVMDELQTQHVIIATTANHENLSKKIISVVEERFFETEEDRLCFSTIKNYIEKYSALPPREAILIDIQNCDKVSQSVIDKASVICNLVFSAETMQFIFNTTVDWIKETTEAYCKTRALYLAITKAIEIIDESPDKKNKLDKGTIPKILQDALSISMDTSVGHDYILDAESRYDIYHQAEQKISTGLRELDKVLNGGFRRKTLSIFVGGTGAGKSMTLCSISASLLLSGFNVLYISLEMPEDVVAKRIDANLMDVDYDKIEFLPRDRYMKKIDDLHKKGVGSVVIKSYPPSSVGSHQFRALINELKVKKGFKPDVIVLDYLAITVPNTVKVADNIYLKTKYVAEEFRALCFEMDAAGVSAAQTVKGSQNTSEFDLKDVGEGHSLSMTADNMFSLIVTEQLEQAGQMRMGILKNRHGSTTDPSSFMLTMERSKMRLSDGMSYSSYIQKEEDRAPIPRSSPERTSNSKARFKDFKVGFDNAFGKSDDAPF